MTSLRSSAYHGILSSRHPSLFKLSIPRQAGKDKFKLSIPRQARKDQSYTHNLSMKRSVNFTSLDKEEKCETTQRDKSQV